MMIHKITPSLDYNKWLIYFKDTQLNEPTNQNPIKLLIVAKPTKIKQLYAPYLHEKKFEKELLKSFFLQTNP